MTAGPYLAAVSRHTTDVDAQVEQIAKRLREIDLSREIDSLDLEGIWLRAAADAASERREREVQPAREWIAGLPERIAQAKENAIAAGATEEEWDLQS